MNWKQIIILIIAIIIAVMIVWHDRPLEFPGIAIKVLLDFVKLSVVAGLAIAAYIFAGKKK